MRDLLTILAAAVLLVLAALWLVPPHVDWRGWRTEIDRTLTAAAGLPVATHGEIRLSLLPAPELSVAGVTIGEAGTSTLAAETIDIGVALMPLLSSRIQVRSLRLQGVEAVVRLAPDGTVLLPALTVTDRPAAFDAIEVMRARLSVIQGSTALVMPTPLALEASAPARQGPWRIAGEIAGRPMRIASGEAAAGQTRLRLSLPPAGAPGLETDGQFGFSGGRLTYAGTWQVRPAGEPALPASAAGRFTLDPTQLALPEMTLEWGPGDGVAIANRMTGELVLPLRSGQRGRLDLASRRLDLGPLPAPVLPPQLAWVRALPMPPAALDLTLATDQMLVGGEDVARVAVAGTLADRALTLRTLEGRIAGLGITATGRIDAAGATFDTRLAAVETARLALALARLGLRSEWADAVAAQGHLDAAGRVAFDARGAVLEGWRGASGGATWTLAASHMPGVTRIDVTGDGFRLDALPSIAATTAGGTLSARLALTRARIGGTQGEVTADLSSDGHVLQLRQLRASGFGGLGLEANGTIGTVGSALDVRLNAPQAAPALALAAPLLPAGLPQRLQSQAAAISPLSLAGTVTQTQDGRSFTGRGMAGPMQVVLDGTAAADGGIGRMRLDLEGVSSSTAAAFLGMPAPHRATDGLRVSASRDGGALSIRATAPGLALAGEGTWPSPDATALFGMTVSADGADRLLPAPLAGMLSPGPIAGTARLARANEGWRLDDIRATGRPRPVGTLAWSDSRMLTGALHLADLDGLRLVAAALGAPRLMDGPATWSTQRLPDALTAFTGQVALTADRIGFGEGATAGPARLALRLSPDETRVESMDVAVAGGHLSGSARIARSGGLGSLAGDIAWRDLDLAALTGGALTGSASGKLMGGGAGETPARIIASLGGQGTLSAPALSLPAASAEALGRTLRADADDLIDAATLERVLAAALAASRLTLPVQAEPLTLTAGSLRLPLPATVTSGSRAEGQVQVDLRSLTLDARLRLALVERPRGWTGALPQATLTWRGPVLAPVRQIDSATLLNSLAQRRLQQELERVAAFEADLRERSFFARRLRVEREMNARPVPEPEQPVFSPGLLPELPAPLQITPMPLPLSRQPSRP